MGVLGWFAFGRISCFLVEDDKNREFSSVFFMDYDGFYPNSRMSRGFPGAWRSGLPRGVPPTRTGDGNGGGTKFRRRMPTVQGSLLPT